jgi:Prokaryotic E2 family E
MSSRIESELALLKSAYPNLEHRPDGHWVRIPVYRLPGGIWVHAEVEVCFQIPAGVPGEAPYGFHVRPHLLLVNGETPSNYTHPVSTAYGDDWGKFSWALDPWAPEAEITRGSTMLNFARSFYGRLMEGA